jgi:hypothetical protein
VTRLSEAEIERRKLAKAVRTAIRLKHSLAADREIAERLPEILEEFDRALTAGRAYRFDPRRLLEEAR